MKNGIKEVTKNMRPGDKLTYLSGKMLDVCGRLESTGKGVNKNLAFLTNLCAKGENGGDFIKGCKDDLRDMKFYLERVEELVDMAEGFSMELQSSRGLVGIQQKID